MPHTFNYNGVCQNPEVITILSHSRAHYARLYIAQAGNGKWGYGYSMKTGNSSRIAGASTRMCIHKSRNKAIAHALFTLSNICQTFVHLPGYKAIIEACSDYLTTHHLAPYQDFRISS